MNHKEYDEMYNDYEGIVCFFDDEDNIIYANERFSSLLGYTKKDIIDINIFDLISPDDRSEFTNAVFVNARKAQFTIRFYHKLGSHMYFSIYSYKFKNRYMIIGEQLKRNYKGYGFEDFNNISSDDDVIINKDVNDISEIIDEQLDSLHLLVGKLPVDLWIKDKNQRYIYMNEIKSIKSNFKKEQYYLKNDFDLYPKAVANEFVSSDMEAIAAHKKVQFLFNSNRTNYSKFTEVAKVPVYNSKDEYIGLIGCAIDITQTKSSEQQLLQEKIATRQLLEHLYDLTFCVNHEGVITLAFGELLKGVKEYQEPQYFEFFKHQDKILELIGDAFKGNTRDEEILLFDQLVQIHVQPVYDEEHQIRVLVNGMKVGE